MFSLGAPAICPGATNFVLLSALTLLATICQNTRAKTLPKNTRNPLPVDMRRSRPSLLKLAINGQISHWKKHSKNCNYYLLSSTP